MTEGEQHLKKKEKVAHILEQSGNFQNVKMEKPTGVMVETSLGMREYTADIYGEAQILTTNGLVIQKIAIEIDGKSHHSQIAVRKDKLRTQKLLEAGIRTVRLPVRYLLAGKHALSDADLLTEIAWQLNQ
jgi:very-short-patch-repair endonuclease